MRFRTGPRSGTMVLGHPLYSDVDAEETERVDVLADGAVRLRDRSRLDKKSCR